MATDTNGGKGLSDPFPDELYESIFVHLSPNEFCILAQVCKRFYRISKSAILWEEAYLTFWRIGDERRDEQRKVRRWREAKKAQYMRALAMKALQRREARTSRNGDPLEKVARVESKARDDRCAPYLPLFGTSSDWSDDPVKTTDLPNFYALFRQRLAIDQVVLDAIQWECLRNDGWVKQIEELLRTYGNDIRDVLHALICVQKRRDKDKGSYETQISTNRACRRRDFDFPKAYQLRKPHAKRSASHHLSILQLARGILQHMQCREAMKGLTALRYPATAEAVPWSALTALHGTIDDPTTAVRLTGNAKQFENALCFLTMFCDGEGQEVSEELDVLAGACALYLQERYPTCRSDALQFATGISSFMRSRGFQGATDANFRNLDNNFIHLCLDESGRDSLPMTLVVIFCAIAARLGLNALPTNTPMKIMAVVDGFIDHSMPAEDRFWVNVHGDGQILSRDAMLGLFGHRGAQAENLITSASTPVEMCTRSARNIVMSIQRAQVMPGFDSERTDDIEAGRSTDDSSRDELLERADEYFERTMHSRRNPFNPRRTFRPARQDQIHLVSTLWDDDMDGDRPLSSSSSSHDASFFATPGRYRRAHRWTEAAQHDAMHAASNALVRCEDDMGQRGLEWSLNLVWTHFVLDLLTLRDEIVEAQQQMSSNQEVQSPFGRAHDDIQTSILGHYNRLVRDDPKIPSRRVWQEETDDEDGNPTTVQVDTSPSGDIIYPIGTVFVHRTYFYRAVTIGWDDRCGAEDDWIDNMGVDSLPNGGANQPFYRALVEDGSTRYVAHCNIRQAFLATLDEARELSAARSIRARIDPTVLLPDELERVMEVHGVGEYFRCASIVDANVRPIRLLCNAAAEREYPDDVNL